MVRRVLLPFAQPGHRIDKGRSCTRVPWRAVFSQRNPRSPPDPQRGRWVLCSRRRPKCCKWRAIVRQGQEMHKSTLSQRISRASFRSCFYPEFPRLLIQSDSLRASRAHPRVGRKEGASTPLASHNFIICLTWRKLPPPHFPLQHGMGDYVVLPRFMASPYFPGWRRAARHGHASYDIQGICRLLFQLSLFMPLSAQNFFFFLSRTCRRRITERPLAS